MKFGELPVREAEGAILAHSQRPGGKRFKKGRVLGTDDIAAFVEAGITHVVAAQLEAGDVPEDEAARQLAEALTGNHLNCGAAFTGRCNLHAASRGFLDIDAGRIDALNRVDEAITVATLPQAAVVNDGQMVATIKIIPFAVSGDALNRCLEIARANGAAMQCRPLRAFRTVLIQTTLADTKTSMLDKTRDITVRRLDALGGELVAEYRCEHNAVALAERVAGEIDHADLMLVVGASAIVDRRDVIPAAVERAGGTVTHFGMPVDPGNLLLTAELNGRCVLDLPGCARSPKYNGFDAVLERFAAGLDTSSADIMAMGVGGLLKEFSGRPVPREGREMGEASAPVVDAIVLAAGQSRRMGAQNKLLVEVDGQAMIKHIVSSLQGASVRNITVVTGFQAEEVEAQLDLSAVRVVHNSAYAQGLSTSLRVGAHACAADADAVVVCLGDMPRIRSEHIDRLIAAFDPVEGREICAPVWRGKRGNPVLWAHRFLEDMADVQGDTGARHLIGANEDVVCEVPQPDDSVLLDIDTPEALEALRRGVS